MFNSEEDPDVSLTILAFNAALAPFIGELTRQVSAIAFEENGRIRSTRNYADVVFVSEIVSGLQIIIHNSNWYLAKLERSPVGSTVYVLPYGRTSTLKEMEEYFSLEEIYEAVAKILQGRVERHQGQIDIATKYLKEVSDQLQSLRARQGKA